MLLSPSHFSSIFQLQTVNTAFLIDLKDLFIYLFIFLKVFLVLFLISLSDIFITKAATRGVL